MSVGKQSPILNNAKVKIQSCLLVLCIVTSCELFSQDQTTWKLNIIDSTITLNLPGDLDTSIVMDRLTIGRLGYEKISFVFMKIDVIDTVPMPKDTAQLRADYEKFLNGFLKRSKGDLIGKQEIKEGNYIALYVKAKINNGGVDYFIEQKAYFLNGDAYTIQIIYPIAKENIQTDLLNKLLNSVIIQPTAKQFSD